MSADRAELYRFMRTLQPPPGVDAATFLARYDEEFNRGGPAAAVQAGVPIGELNGWRLSADVYSPVTASPAPQLLYLHGGGWTMGNPRSHDRMARMFAAAGYLVASIDYPRAPKWPFPDAFDACVQALRWFAREGSSLGGDPERVFVAGDSAGANLAAAVSVAETGVRLTAAALLYGIYDYRRALPVLGPIMGGDAADTQVYVPAGQLGALRGDPRLSPEVAADRMPPAWIGVGADDPLLAESADLSRTLAGLGQPHELYVAPGSPHSFMQIPTDPGYEKGWQAMLAFLEAQS